MRANFEAEAAEMRARLAARKERKASKRRRRHGEEDAQLMYAVYCEAMRRSRLVLARARHIELNLVHLRRSRRYEPPHEKSMTAIFCEWARQYAERGL